MANKIVEGLWDCKFCGSTRIRGLQKTCPTCGHPQEKDTKFYMGEAITYLDADTAKNYGQGADWTCPYCDSLNRYTAEACAVCGAPKEESESDYFGNQQRMQQQAAEKEAELQSLLGNQPPQGATQREAGGVSPVPKKKKRVSGCFFLLPVLLVLFGILIAALIPKNKNFVVQDKSWNREAQVEVYKTVHESDWSVPSGGRVTDQKEEWHHDEHVIDHYETVEVEKSRQVQDGYDVDISYVDNGDGTFSEVEHQTPRYVTEYYTETEERPIYVDIPVYKTKYYYDIEKWVYARSEYADGTSDDPYWPELTLGEDERAGDQIGTYTLTLYDKKKDKTHIVELSQEAWESVKSDQSVNVKVSGGKVISVNDYSAQEK